jgi:ribonuclease T2
VRRLLLALAALGCAALPAAAQEPRGRPGEFDYFVLSLSWSPTYCLGEGAERGDRRQCGAERPRGFILHGLWPQWERGWPEFCMGRNAPRVPDGTLSRMLDIMPSPGLVIHQWRKHGTCSGLAPQTYFDTARRAFERIEVPERFRSAADLGQMPVEAVERAFLDANPALSRDGVAVTCRDGLLEEVRVCLSRTLTPRRCPDVERRSCAARTLVVPGGARRL